MIVGEYTGELITMEEYRERVKIVKLLGASNYFFNTCTNMVVDATAMGNHTRFY